MKRQVCSTSHGEEYDSIINVIPKRCRTSGSESSESSAHGTTTTTTTTTNEIKDMIQTPVRPPALNETSLSSTTKSTTAKASITTTTTCKETNNPDPVVAEEQEQTLTGGNTQWEVMFQRLVQYQKENGHCMLSQYDDENKELATWVKNQRSKKTRSIPSLTPYRIQKLDSIGFVWRLAHRAGSNWEEMFERLVRYKKENGHCNVSQYDVDNKELGCWVRNQRRAKTNSAPSLTPHRIQKLESIGFAWKQSLVPPFSNGLSSNAKKLRDDKNWDEMFQSLVQYKKEYGNFNVYPKRDKELACWVYNQRWLYNSVPPNLPKNRIRKLESIGFAKKLSGLELSANEKWEEMFERLVQYKKEYGNCNVTRHGDGQNKELGYWVQKQRTSYTNSVPSLTPYRIQKLESIGFVWRLMPFRRRQWEEMFQWLVEYKKENGHCNVSQDDVANKELRYWVLRQQSSKVNSNPCLTPDRIKKLESIDGFVWKPTRHYKPQQPRKNKPPRKQQQKIRATTTLVTDWDKKFNELILFKIENGHCNVPVKYEQNQSLATWVYKQREAVNNIMNAVGTHTTTTTTAATTTGVVPAGVRPDQKKRLDDIGFEWCGCCGGEADDIDNNDDPSIWDDKQWLHMYYQLEEAKKVFFAREQYDSTSIKTWSNNSKKGDGGSSSPDLENNNEDDLNSWEVTQQEMYMEGTIDLGREAILEELGYWRSIGLKRS